MSYLLNKETWAALREEVVSRAGDEFLGKAEIDARVDALALERYSHLTPSIEDALATERAHALKAIRRKASLFIKDNLADFLRRILDPSDSATIAATELDVTFTCADWKSTEKKLRDWTLEDIRTMRDSIELKQIAASQEYTEWAQIADDAARAMNARGSERLGDLLSEVSA